MAGAAAGRLSLLGGWTLWVGPKPVRTSPAVQRLVALLGLRGAQCRAVAAGRLFPGRPERAAARLRDLLWHATRSDPMLRRVIVADSDQLGLAPQVVVDVEDLRAAVGDLEAGRPGALDRLPERVDLLTGWDEPWVVHDRDTLSAELRRALLGWCQDRLERGDPGATLIAAERAASLDPLDEPVLRWQLRAHLALGDMATAVVRFEAFARLLHTELGVDPESATCDLVRPFQRAPGLRKASVSG